MLFRFVLSRILLSARDGVFQEELTRRLPMKINAAFDKQMEKGQHFDIISQVPKKGHKHEQVYVQRVKPPSLVTATLAPYNIVSCLGLDRHHWAPPAKRPESPHDAPKPRMANPNARPRSSDIITVRQLLLLPPLDVTRVTRVCRASSSTATKKRWPKLLQNKLKKSSPRTGRRTCSTPSIAASTTR